MAFWKRQKYRDHKKVSGCQEFKGMGTGKIGEAPETCMAAWGPSPWAMVGVGICQGSEWTEEPEEPALPWWVSGWAPSRALAWPHLGMPMLRAHVQGLGVQGPLQHESRVRRPKPPLHPRPELCLWHLFQKQRPLLFSVWAPASCHSLTRKHMKPRRQKWAISRNAKSQISG